MGTKEGSALGSSLGDTLGALDFVGVTVDLNIVGLTVVGLIVDNAVFDCGLRAIVGAVVEGRTFVGAGEESFSLDGVAVDFGGLVDKFVTGLKDGHIDVCLVGIVSM